MAKMIKITLTKSTIGASPKQRKVVEALGLKKMHHSVELADTPLGNQVPVAADHAACFRNDRLLIDRTEFFKFQTGCL